jgi:hypothetical protein
VLICLGEPNPDVLVGKVTHVGSIIVALRAAADLRVAATS